MNHRTPPGTALGAIVTSTACAALAVVSANALAGEGYKLRQAPMSIFGGEMAAGLDNTGPFGTVMVTQSNLYKLTDANGNNASLAPRTIPLPTGKPTGGAIPNGQYALNVPAGTIDFNEKRTTVNLIGGYMTETDFSGGHIAFMANLPLITANRHFDASYPAGTVSGSPPVSSLPPPLQGAVGAIAAAVNGQVQAAAAAQTAFQNQRVTGVGDLDLSATWIRHQDRTKLAAGAILSLPTGKYDPTRGPNPGFGYGTLRLTAAATHNLAPEHADTNWDTGVTLGGRVMLGMNATNKDTQYKSGNFVYLEGGAIKVWGNWGLGLNLSATYQVTDDTGPTAPSDGFRYTNYAVGPFLAYKLPLKDAGINLSFSQNFGGRNAAMTQNLQVRLIRAW